MRSLFIWAKHLPLGRVLVYSNPPLAEIPPFQVFTPPHSKYGAGPHTPLRHGAAASWPSKGIVSASWVLGFSVFRAQIKFTCNLCGVTTIRPVNPHAWTHGSVFGRCGGCDIIHKVHSGFMSVRV